MSAKTLTPGLFRRISFCRKVYMLAQASPARRGVNLCPLWPEPSLVSARWSPSPRMTFGKKMAIRNKGPLANRRLRSEPFEVRMARCPSDDVDVFGPTMSKHVSLEAARNWRTHYYQNCLEQQILPPPLVIVEVRHNCLIRYTGKRAFAIYSEGGQLRTEDLRVEMCFSLESALGATVAHSDETQAVDSEEEQESLARTLTSKP